MARYKIECCYQCQNRCPGCHSTCEDYKTQRAELDDTREAHRKQVEAKNGLDCFLYDSIHRCSKRSHYRSKYRRNRCNYVVRVVIDF